jgi:hypothetical protein
LTQQVVDIPVRRRAAVGIALWQEFARLEHWLLIAAVSRRHVHLLVKLPKGGQRHLVGRAKRFATLAMRGRGWVGKLWATRCKCVPINDRAHQRNVFKYIEDHAAQGAWVGIWRTPPGEAGE